MRHFLVLQGNSSPFFLALGRALYDRKHRVTKMNFCGGDRVFWHGWREVDFTGKRDEFACYLADFCQRNRVTDLILHNDCRPFHRIAIDVANRLELVPWVYEEGYLRPNWLTLERGGSNGFSRMPDDPDWYLKQVDNVPEYDDVAVGAGFKGRVLHDFKWQGMNYVYAHRYPYFQTHRPYPIWAEYATWAKRLSTIYWRRYQARRVVDDLVKNRREFFLFPLQLDSDSQLRVHSDFGGLLPSVEYVISSFCAHAHPDSYLLIKNHPLDNGWVNIRRKIDNLAQKRGVSSRILFIDGGDLDYMLEHAAAVVTVNSTVGMTAITRHLPVMLLGRAVYGVPGLVSEFSLDDFWCHRQPPNKALLGAFVSVLRHAAIINGNYYTDEGIALAVKESISRMEMDLHFLDGAPKPARLMA